MDCKMAALQEAIGVIAPPSRGEDLFWRGGGGGFSHPPPSKKLHKGLNFNKVKLQVVWNAMENVIVPKPANYHYHSLHHKFPVTIISTCSEYSKFFEYLPKNSLHYSCREHVPLSISYVPYNEKQTQLTHHHGFISFFGPLINNTFNTAPCNISADNENVINDRKVKLKTRFKQIVMHLEIYTFCHVAISISPELDPEAVIFLLFHNLSRWVIYYLTLTVLPALENVRISPSKK